DEIRHVHDPIRKLCSREGRLSMPTHVLAIDQGTTGATVMIFDASGRVRGRAYSEFRQYYPRPGWVEHDPEEIWRVTQRVIGAALRRARLKPTDIAAIGITNQRETPSCGTVSPAKRCTAPSSGRTGARRPSAMRSKRKVPKGWSAPRR